MHTEGIKKHQKRAIIGLPEKTPFKWHLAGGPLSLGDPMNL